MAAKFLICSVLFLVLTFVNGIQVNSDGKIKMTVVTSSFCGDTVRFFGNHLIDAYRLYGNFLDLEFVAWGRTDWDGVGQITCTRHPFDCWANRVHRCVLNKLNGNQAAQMNYMACEFTYRYAFLEGSYQCAQTAGINLMELDFCVANDHDDLDRETQRKSDEIISVLDFVPSIVFNDEINQENQNMAQTRLVNMICLALREYPASGITDCPDE